MTAWRITPEGVEQVLLNVSAVAQTLSPAVEGLPMKAEAAIAGSGDCPIIADALVGFFEHHKPTLEAIGNRISASVNGAGAATTAYVEGDLQMAQQHQQAAAGVAGTGSVRGGHQIR